ncbi:hypothetical protein EV102420_08_03440 [Pseudescherichia vulneris NBRC 102420]|uniref:Uncharacterized protein n=1 Tax=Pseudescherichia vulneris NBRC 102420 TaxID=1115515 RepID=A0A090UZA9_PSEVU|nr:hypothetical protein EV102420_08_03440 [Pseudescherichia vulneris NBRC 102420]
MQLTSSKGFSLFFPKYPYLNCTGIDYGKINKKGNEITSASDGVSTFRSGTQI